MQHITGISHHQMRIFRLEDAISPDNQVRFIDAFVGYIDLCKLGFAVKTLKTEGRLSFNSKVFQEIYLYGYGRSGRDLEKATDTNHLWLLLFRRESTAKWPHSLTFRKIIMASNYLAILCLQ